MGLLNRSEDVADEVVRRAGLVTTAQGAETDAGRKVYRGRGSQINRDLVPCSVVIEGDDTLGRDNANLDYEVSQRYGILGFVPCDPDHPNVAAHAAIRDIKRAMFTTNGKADRKWGGRVREVKYVGRDIVQRADSEPFVQVIVEIEVQFVENMAAP